MIIAAKCWTRKCKHYLGVITDFEPEGNERHSCKAYPNGIPERIAYGNNKHLTIHKDQKGDFVFEKNN